MLNRILHAGHDPVHAIARDHAARTARTRSLSAARGILLAAMIGAVLWAVLLIVAVSAIRALT